MKNYHPISFIVRTKMELGGEELTSVYVCLVRLIIFLMQPANGVFKCRSLGNFHCRLIFVDRTEYEIKTPRNTVVYCY